MEIENLTKLVEQELNNTNFPFCSTRKNVSDTKIQAFALGKVNYRGQAFLKGRTKGPSRYNRIFPKLYRLIRKLIKQSYPDFKYTTIQVNKNVLCSPHIDKNNVGPSYIIGLGDYTNGELVIEGKEFDINHKWKYFDGTNGHWVSEFKGTRYTIVFFTHTFKPPHPNVRFLTVTKEGIYNKNKELIKHFTK